ncbi:MAG: hypothetical protein ACOX7H_07125 [Bacillota bacterium]|jgi:hypothetical protein
MISPKYDERKYKKIAVLENFVEIEIAAMIFKEANIPHYIKSLEDSAYGNIFQLTRGFAEIWAPEEYRKQIDDLLLQMRQGSMFVYEDE